MANDVEPGSSSFFSAVESAFAEWVVAPINDVIFFDLAFWDNSPAAGDAIQLPIVVAWLVLGALFFTFRFQFVNIRGFRHGVDCVRGKYSTPSDVGEISHFQALSAALSATVGLGNIAGVAFAVGIGGPGAVFWMIVGGLIGMSSKFAECTLGQRYRIIDAEGRITGGPMVYLKTGLAEIGHATLGRVLSVIFALMCIGASFGGGNAFQIGQSLEAVRGDVPILEDYPIIYGIGMAILVGIVIVGGMRSIGAVASKIVPFMCGAYVLAALYILVSNASAIPDAVVLICTEAFKPNAMYGGFLGVLVIGVKRAVFSNEAGVGSAAIAHSAAKTEEPVSEGIVALLEPFIDTVVVCTITALVVIVTGAYNHPDMVEAIADDQGAKITLFAFTTGGYDWFKYILYVAVVLFAYSTCISWSYYGERCWVQLFGARMSIVYKLLFLGFTVLGSVVTAGNILAFSDLMILGMSFPNLLGVFLLSGIVKRRLDVYWQKYKSGELMDDGENNSIAQNE